VMVKPDIFAAVRKHAAGGNDIAARATHIQARAKLAAVADARDVLEIMVLTAACSLGNSSAGQLSVLCLQRGDRLIAVDGVAVVVLMYVNVKHPRAKLFPCREADHGAGVAIA